MTYQRHTSNYRTCGTKELILDAAATFSPTVAERRGFVSVTPNVLSHMLGAYKHWTRTHLLQCQEQGAVILTCRPELELARSQLFSLILFPSPRAHLLWLIGKKNTIMAITRVLNGGHSDEVI